jgi:hypothetical protein
MRLGIILLPMSWLLPAKPPAKPHDGQEPAPDQQGQVIATKVARAIKAAARRLPIPMLCLPRALAGRIMLRRRGVPCLLHLGTLRDGDSLTAHAWLTAGSFGVCGLKEAAGYIEVGRYA